MYTCWDCGGSGMKPAFFNIANGICFTCAGKGVTHKPTQANPYDEICGTCNTTDCICDAHCKECGAMPCHCESNQTNEKVEKPMNQREINKLIFKYIVKNIVEREDKLLPYSFILPRINKMNWCSEETARQFVYLMWKKEYITNEIHDGVYKVGLTKKACDQIRAWNAEEEEEAERAYMVNAENFKENPSGTKSVSDYEPSGEYHDYDAHGTRLL